MSARPPRHHSLAWVRLVVAGAAGLATAAVAAAVAALPVALPLGWVVAASIYLAWTWAVVILPLEATQTARHATREDPSVPVADLVLLSASVMSLGGIALLLSRAVPKRFDELVAALAVLTVAASWLVTHTVFTLRYARLYYTGPDGGVDFNQATPPRYTDFAYLAFTIGMTYQVSDTNLRTPEIRSTALRHGLLSFLLGAVVLATTVNLVASLGSGG